MYAVVPKATMRAQVCGRIGGWLVAGVPAVIFTASINLVGAQEQEVANFLNTQPKNAEAIYLGCRTILAAPAYAVSQVQHPTEHGDRIRAALLEIQSKLPIPPHWEEIARRSMLHVQYTDCRSLADHLTASIPKQVDDKRLSIELAGLRQSLWEEDVPSHQLYHLYRDDLRWIPTYLQMADCFAKSMKPRLLNSAIESIRFHVLDTSPADAPTSSSRRLQMLMMPLDPTPIGVCRIFLVSFVVRSHVDK